MQGLVAVGFGMAHPVAQAVGVRLVYLVDGHIDVETFVDLFLALFGLEDDTHGEDVVYLVEVDMLVLHLVPDGVGAFHPCLDVVFQSHLVECLTYRGCKVGEEFIARCLCVGQFFLYGAVFFGVFKLEAQVFQFGLDLVQSQSVGQGSIDVECFAGNFVLLVGGLAVERAHVVQSVAYLDEDDTYVVAHGEQQFLEVFSLC